MDKQSTDSEESGSAKRPLARKTERLQKVLARMGVGSRREMETWIKDGRIVVNGEKAILGQQVGADDQIRVDGRAIKQELVGRVNRRVVVYNKPDGEICSRNDPEGRPSVFAKLPKLRGERWIAVGRLDFNTAGLLIFTTDGELANRLMHPSSDLEREYMVRVMGDVDEAMIRRLQQGVMLEDGMAQFTKVEDAGGTGINHWWSVVVKEGRNREVRRLWESQGVTVSRLKRIRFGQTRLPANLKRGQWHEMLPKEVDALGKMVGMESVPVARLTPKEQDERKRLRQKASYWKSAPNKRGRKPNNRSS